jgi:DNA-binding GntR family transcriptional regulator
MEMQVTKIEPLHNQVYQLIKQMIVEGKLRPGERVVEVKLAERLGTSRGPIREAIRMLVQDGLLVQNEKVLSIFNPNARDIIDVFQCRQGLECLAARLAAEHITDEQLEQLEQIIQKSRKALENEDTEELSQLDQQFHDLIAFSSNNGQLIQLYEVIKSKIIYIRTCIIRNYYKNFLNFLDEHQLIYEALKERNPIKADDEIRMHIQKNLEVSYTLYDTE